MTTPTTDQILAYIREHPGTSTKDLVLAFEDPSDEERFFRAYRCVGIKLIRLADRGDVKRLRKGNRKLGQCWEVS